MLIGHFKVLKVFKVISIELYFKSALQNGFPPK